MRKLFILTLGLVLAAASTTAFAGGRYDRGWSDHRYDHRHDRRGGTHRDAYLVGGLLLGLAAGAALADDDDDWRRGGYHYDGRYGRDRYRGGYHGGGYYNGGYYGSAYHGHHGGRYDSYRPYYGGREVIVYRDRSRWNGRRHHGGPRRVEYRYDYRGRRW